MSFCGTVSWLATCHLPLARSAGLASHQVRPFPSLLQSVLAENRPEPPTVSVQASTTGLTSASGSMASPTAQTSLNCDPEDVISERQTDIETHVAAPAVTAVSTPKHNEPTDEEAGAEGPVDDDSTLDGYMLWSVAIGVCFGALMMSLDISIIGTVSAPPIHIPLPGRPPLSELAADKSARGRNNGTRPSHPSCPNSVIPPTSPGTQRPSRWRHAR